MNHFFVSCLDTTRRTSERISDLSPTLRYTHCLKSLAVDGCVTLPTHLQLEPKIKDILRDVSQHFDPYLYSYPPPPPPPRALCVWTSGKRLSNRVGSVYLNGTLGSYICPPPNSTRMVIIHNNMIIITCAFYWSHCWGRVRLDRY